MNGRQRSFVGWAESSRPTARTCWFTTARCPWRTDMNMDCFGSVIGSRKSRVHTIFVINAGKGNKPLSYDEIARRLGGCYPNALYPIMCELSQRGIVNKHGSGKDVTFSLA